MQQRVYHCVLTWSRITDKIRPKCTTSNPDLRRVERSEKEKGGGNTVTKQMS